MRKLSVVAFLPLLALIGFLSLLAQSAPDFARDIQPVFEKNCSSCHGEKVQSAGLRLDRKESAAPKLNEIYRRISSSDAAARMPLGGQLPAAQIALIKAWIDSGAAWPDSAVTSAAPKPKHWAFIPPRRPALPEVHDTAWVRNPIDRFILAKLESEGLKPSPKPTAPHS